MFGKFAQEASHDFAGAGFRQGLDEADVVGAGEGADLFRDPGAELLAQLGGRFGAGFEGDEDGDGLAFELVGFADSAASATEVWATSADSTSMVPRRWPLSSF